MMGHYIHEFIPHVKLSVFISCLVINMSNDTSLFYANQHC